MATGVITISGSLSGTLSVPTGARPIGPLVISLPAAIEAISMPALTTGNNGPYAVPTGASFILLIMPSTNINLVTLKGATSGDAGLPLNKTLPSLIALDPTATAINLLAAGPVPSGVEIQFF